MDHNHHQASDIPAGTETAKDPVCGMTVAVKPHGRHAEFHDETFHFCSEKYEIRFKVDPWLHAYGQSARRKKVARANVQYTCPMHPKIVRDAPGACPINKNGSFVIEAGKVGIDEVRAGVLRLWRIDP